MEEMTGMEPIEVVVAESEEAHRSRGRWGIVAAVVAAVAGGVYGVMKVRARRHSHVPMTMA